MPVINKSSLKVQAYNYLKECILSGKLESGVLYTEMNLAKELGISRTPVREAVLQLAHEDYVTLKPNKGFLVKTYTIEEIKEYLDVRKAVEGFCGMETLKEKNTDRWNKLIKKLEKILDEADMILRKGTDPEGFMKKDAEFHFEIVSFAKNSQMERIMFDMRDKMNKIGLDSEKIEGRSEDTQKEHRAIFEALKRNDRKAIYSSYEYHFDKCLDAMQQALALAEEAQVG